MPHIDRRGMRRPAVARLLVLVCGGLAWLGVPGTAHAQIDPSGSIRGVVRDERGAVLRGVTLTATAPEVARPSETATDDIGDYTLVDMRPGTYQIVARLDGFATTVRENVRVQAGLNVGLDLVMRIGRMGETITVTADTPMLEIRSPSTALNLSGELQRALPLAPRPQWFDALRATPSSSVSENIYGASFWVNGADSFSLVVQIDGADVGASGSSTTGYLKASPYIIQDVKIKTTGGEASTPLGQGATVSIVSRTGTNAWNGAVAVSGQPREWVANNNPSGTSATYGVVQPDVAFGGPIKRDRLWFFGAYHYNAITSGIDRPAGQIELARQLRPGIEPFDNSTTGHQTFGKVTWQASPTRRLEGAHLYGVDSILAGAALDTAPFARTNLGGHTVSLSGYTLWGSKTAVRGLVTFNNQTATEKLASLSVPSRLVHLSASRAGDILVGDGAAVVLDNVFTGSQLSSPAAKLTAAVDISRPLTFLRGVHDVRVGAYLQPIRHVQFDVVYPAGGFALEELVLRDPANPVLGAIPFHRQIVDRELLTTTDVNSQDYAAYVQDTWQVASHLTLTLGLRADSIKRHDQLFDATVQQTLALGPRVGMLYAWNDGRRVLRASWSRIHDAVSSGSDTSVGSGTPGITDLYDTNLDGVFEISRFTPGVTGRTTNRFIDLDAFGQPFADETMVGLAQQLPGQFSVDISLAHRRYRDRLATIDVNSRFVNGQFVGYQDEAFNQLYRIGNNEYNTPVYTALDIQFAKRSSRLQIVGGYTRQWRHIVGDWQPNDPASILQPDAFPNDRGLGVLFRATQNSLSGIDMTLGSQWRDHVVRVMSNVRLPASFSVGASYWGQAGPWSGPVVTRLTSPDPSVGPPSITLSNGRVVTNPLASTNIRFAYSTRGEGQFRLPSVHALNLRVARDMAWQRVTIRPSVEMLNVFNRRAFYDVFRNANQRYNPVYGRGNTVQLPRALQAAIQVVF